MFGDPPRSVPEDLLAEVVARSWIEGLEALDYQRVGFGSWHWLARTATGDRVFVTLDAVSGTGSLALDSLRRAFRVPLELVRYGLRFARAPLPTAGGDVLVELPEGWAVSAWPYVDGRTNRHDDYPASDRGEVLDALRVLHDVGLHVTAAAQPDAETFAVRHRAFLSAALAGATGPWSDGPYAARALALLDASKVGVRDLLDEYDDLVARAPGRDSWVLTHGEPHAANAVFTANGPVLIDWDTAKVAPPERDLRMVAPEVGDPAMVRLYELQWALEEIGGYLEGFHAPHDDTPDSAAAWQDLTRYLPVPSPRR